MTDCVQNLIIFFLIIILFYSAHAYIHNRKKKSNHVNSIINNAIEEDKVVGIYPINNNINNHNDLINLNDLNDLNDLNNHEYVPDNNVVLIEENKVVTGDTFNYDKTINTELNGFDADDKYLSVN